MNRSARVEGLQERVDQVCFESGLTKPQLCKKMGLTANHCMTHPGSVF